MSTHTTLATAHKIKALRAKGLTERKIAAKVGVSQKTVNRVLNGKYMLQQQRLGDMMELFTDGVIRGTGNYKFHAASPGDDNDDGHEPSLPHHPLDATHADGEKVIVGPDVLSVLLAEEDLIERVLAAGLDPETLMVVDYESDTDDGTGKFENSNAAQRDAAVHAETYEQFMERTERDAHGSLGAYRTHCLENEGQDIDAWKVRKNPEDTGLWGTPWVHPRERGE